MRGVVKSGLGSAVLAVIALSSAFYLASAVAHAQSETTLGIDVDPTGNTESAVGSREVCAEVATGDTFQVDIVVQNVTQLSAWEAYLAIDTSVVNIIDRDVQLFLANNPNGNAFDVSESVPEDQQDNGLYRVGAAAIGGDDPVGVDGSGVLARLTLKAVGPGLTTLSIKEQDTGTELNVGPTLSDTEANRISDDDGDGFFDGPLLDAEVAVDQACPGGGGVAPAGLASGGDDGLAWWIPVAVAGAIAAAAVIGAVAFIRVRRAGELS